MIFQSLPIELLYIIAQFLDENSLKNFRLVDKYLSYNLFDFYLSNFLFSIRKIYKLDNEIKQKITKISGILYESDLTGIFKNVKYINGPYIHYFQRRNKIPKHITIDYYDMPPETDSGLAYLFWYGNQIFHENFDYVPQVTYWKVFKKRESNTHKKKYQNNYQKKNNYNKHYYRKISCKNKNNYR